MDSDSSNLSTREEGRLPATRPAQFASIKPAAASSVSIRGKFFILILGLTLIAILPTLAIAINSVNRVIQQAADASEQSIKKQLEDELVNYNQRMAAQNALIFDRAVRDLQTIAETTAAIYNGQIPLTTVQSKLTIGPEGQAFSTKENRSSIFIPNSIMSKSQSDPELTRAIKRDIELVSYLDLTNEAVKQTNPNVTTIYLGTSNDVYRSYPNNLLGGAVSPDFQATHQSWYISSLEGNIRGIKQRPVWLPIYLDAVGNRLMTSIAEPVYDRQGRLIGVVGLDLNLEELKSNIENARFHKTGYSFLLDDQGYLIILPAQGYQNLFGLEPDPDNPMPNLFELIEDSGSSQQTRNDLELVFENMQHGERGSDSIQIGDKEFYIAYSPISRTISGLDMQSGRSTDPGWILASVITTNNLLNDVVTLQQAQTREWRSTILTILLPVILFIGLICFLLAWLGTNWLVRPLRKLAVLAGQLKDGEWDLSLPALTEVQNQNHDEIGLVAGALVETAGNVKQSIRQLDISLAEQTLQLERRTLQLNATAEIGRLITQAQDQDSLLQSVVDLIYERFDYYHVCIFLIDELGEYALLKVANGKLGTRLLEADIRLKVGQQGMVGYVTRYGLPRVSGDVQNDPLYVASPLLPETHSELSLPIRSGHNIIGALDIQSGEPHSFNKNDQIAFQSIADQLASAIENLRLASQLQIALTETDRIIQAQTINNWERLFPNQEFLAYEYDQLEVRKALHSLEIDTKSDQSNALHLDEMNPPQRGWLHAPVKLRDQIIGTIVIESQDADHTWTEDEITIVEATANQAALTVENARLLAESQRRAQREQLISEVTGKFRSSLDLETVLKTAVREIGQRVGNGQVEINLRQAGDRVIGTGYCPDNRPTRKEARSKLPEKPSGGNGRDSKDNSLTPGQRSNDAI